MKYIKLLLVKLKKYHTKLKQRFCKHKKFDAYHCGYTITIKAKKNVSARYDVYENLHCPTCLKFQYNTKIKRNQTISQLQLYLGIDTIHFKK